VAYHEVPGVKQFFKKNLDHICDVTPITKCISYPIDIQLQHSNSCFDWLTKLTLYSTKKLKCPTQPDVPLYLNSPYSFLLWAEFGLASRLGQFTKLSTYLFRNMRTRC